MFLLISKNNTCVARNYRNYPSLKINKMLWELCSIDKNDEIKICQIIKHRNKTCWVDDE